MTIEPKMPPNPKQIFGDKKPPLDQFPLSAHIHACLALADGANKYGFRNWRDQPVEARTYIKGALRHLRLFEVGEDNTRDSNIHNLGAVIAGCAILIDAQLHGTMIDNRRHSPEEADLLHSAEAIVAHLADLQAERDASKRDKLKEEGLCVDEGCDHYGTKHICITASITGMDDAAARRRALFPTATVEGPNGPEFPPEEPDASHHSGEFPDNPAESFGLDGDTLRHRRPKVEDAFELPARRPDPPGDVIRYPRDAIDAG